MTSRGLQKRRGRRAPHTLGGCITCRRRHVKCDQVKPLCLVCKAANVRCDGYSADVRWVDSASMPKTSETTQTGGGKTTSIGARRFLYSEQSRESMSTALTARLGSKSLDASLAQIDAQTKDVVDPDTGDIVLGPFGVLNFNAKPSDTTDREPREQQKTQEGPQTRDNVLNEQLVVEDTQLTPSTLDSAINPDDLLQLQWADLFELDFPSLLGSDNLDVLSDPRYSSFLDGTSFVQAPLPATGEILMKDTGPSVGSASRGAVPVHNARELQNNHDFEIISDAPADAHFLLKNFRDKVIPFMSITPVQYASSWETMNLSSAVQTLAGMTFLGVTNTKYACAANLFAVLVSSALQLSLNPSTSTPKPTEVWADFIVEYHFKAKSYLQKSLQYEFKGSNKAKYKDQLMAILGMLAFAVMSDNQKDARCYMIDAERLLRVRGLAKRQNSRKARRLHHLYTYMRIIGESTYVLHDYKSQSPIVDRRATESTRRQPPPPSSQQQPQRSSLNDNDPKDDNVDAPTRTAKDNSNNDDQRRPASTTKLDDFLRLENHRSDDSDLDFDEPKDPHVGLHDIHLEESREYRDAMSMQIYGVPETCLSLISQTTRLANMMDVTRLSSRGRDAKIASWMEKRASRLEHMICAWASKTSVPEIVADDNTVDNAVSGPPHNAASLRILAAINSALVILFYRRIRNVNALILQGHVDNVIQALHDFETETNTNMSSTSVPVSAAVRPGNSNTGLVAATVHGGTLWPAFIAGCEALTPSRRDALRNWMDKRLAASYLPNVKAAKDLMVEVWRRRDQGASGVATAAGGDGGGSGGGDSGSNNPSGRVSGRARSRGRNRARSSTNFTAGGGAEANQPWTWIDVAREKDVWVMLC